MADVELIDDVTNISNRDESLLRISDFLVNNEAQREATLKTKRGAFIIP